MGVKRNEYMETWVSLVHAGTYFPAELSNHLQKRLGISLAEQDLLKQLSMAGGELKLVELSRRLFLSKAGVTKMMDRLEATGHVVRVRSETDRRVINARMSKSGMKTFSASQDILVHWVEVNLRDQLSEKQILALKDALEGLLKNHGRWEGQLKHLKGDPG